MAVNRAYPVPHGDPIIHRDGVEFFSNAASSFNLLGNQFAGSRRCTCRYKLGKGVNNGDDRFAEIGIGHSGCAPQRAAPAILRPCVVVAERYLGMLFYSHLCLCNGTVRAVPF